MRLQRQVKEEPMTEKERIKKGALWMSCSLGSYAFAFLQPTIGAWLHVSENYIAFAILIWVIAGAASACKYGSLPEADVSEEVIEELQKMIDERKNREKDITS